MIIYSQQNKLYSKIVHSLGPYANQGMTLENDHTLIDAS